MNIKCVLPAVTVCWSILIVLLATGCRKRSETVVLPPFSVTNAIVGGEPKEVITLTNGMSFTFAQSNLVIWFGEKSSIVVYFAPDSLKASSVMLEMPPSKDQSWQTVADLNADGVPEIRNFGGETQNQILFRGEWYYKTNIGHNAMISVDGRDRTVRYDGRRWVEVVP